MGFLDRVRGRSTSEPSMEMGALTLHAAGSVQIVGESYRQDVRRKVAASATDVAPYLEELKGRARGSYANDTKKRWFRAALFREPDNQYDPNAIAVHAAGYGLIGYLDRQAAIDYRPVFDELHRQGVRVGACPAKLTGGLGDDSMFGAILCLSSPEAVLGDLRASHGIGNHTG